jgi:hypothetical protein
MRWTLAIVLSLVISAQAARADEWGAEIVSQPLSGEIARLAVEACDDVTYQDIVDECASWFWMRTGAAPDGYPCPPEPHRDNPTYPVVYLTWHIWCTADPSEPEHISRHQVVEHTGGAILNGEQLISNLYALIDERC